MQVSLAGTVIAGVVLLALVAGGAVALFHGLRVRGEAKALGARAARAEAMLAASPAPAMLVRADGRVEMPRRLADWLGLPAIATSLSELSVDGIGLLPDDATGLAADVQIVQRAGRMLGHAIGLDSAPGRGSTFSVAAPVAAVGLRSPRPAMVAQRRGLGARAVLVVDNEATILDGMRAVLEGWGCTVLTALDEAAARAIPPSAQDEVDVILADYLLSDGVTGDDVVAGLRRHLGRAVPAVIITADRMPDLKDRLVASGLHVLQKPVKPAQLRALLARLSR